MASFELLNASQYYAMLIDRIPKSTDRIYICSMTFETGPKIDKILSLIRTSIKRQVKVSITIDIYSLSLRGEERKNVLKQKRLINSYLSDFKKAGAEINIVGKIGVNPFAHRTHVKATVIDDLVISFGGINFSESSFENNDYMLYATDHLLANKIIDLIELSSNEVNSNLMYKSSATNEILYDGGIKDKSIIYDKACELALNAKSVVFVSRMCPSGKLATLLPKENSLYYFNQASQSKFPTNLSITYDQLKYKLDNSYKGDKYVHAKLILFTMKNNNKYLITGSNNFNYMGVKFGTKEIALMSQDRYLWDELHNFISAI